MSIICLLAMLICLLSCTSPSDESPINTTTILFTMSIEAGCFGAWFTSQNR